MNLRPPRDVPRPSQELQRLAEEGARNAARANQVEQRLRQLEEDMHLRVALGAHYGSPRRRWCAAVAVGGGALLVAMAAEALSTDLQGVATVALCAGFFGAALLQPAASSERVDAERRWVEALPFVLDGYFDCLAQPPQPVIALLLDVRFAHSAPARDLFRGLLGRADPGARLEGEGAGRIVAQSRPVSGSTGRRINGKVVYRSHRLVPYVHQLIDRVLLPLHAEYPLSEVRLERVPVPLLTPGAPSAGAPSAGVP